MNGGERPAPGSYCKIALPIGVAPTPPHPTHLNSDPKRKAASGAGTASGTVPGIFRGGRRLPYTALRPADGLDPQV